MPHRTNGKPTSEISNVDRTFQEHNFSQAIIEQKIRNHSPSPGKNGFENQGAPSVVGTSSKGRYLSPKRLYHLGSAEQIADGPSASPELKRFIQSNTGKKYITKASKKGGSTIHSNFKINQNSLQKMNTSTKKSSHVRDAPGGNLSKRLQFGDHA